MPGADERPTKRFLERPGWLRVPVRARAASDRGAIMEQTRSEILKTIPYGFYITGVVGADGGANGFTPCWVSQVSFKPQQVVVAVHREPAHPRAH